MSNGTNRLAELGLSTQELKALLQESETAEKKEKQQKRKAYVNKRDNLVNSLLKEAQDLSSQMEIFKAKSFELLGNFRVDMMEYGNISTDNKGSYSIKSSDGLQKVEYTNHVIKEFDERSEAAAQLMDDFLKEEFVKKKEHHAYEVIRSLLTRKGKDQKFDVNLINRLEQMRDEFDHPKWIQSLDLFKESYTENGSALYCRFYKKNPESQSWQMVPLNFSSI